MTSCLFRARSVCFCSVAAHTKIKFPMYLPYTSSTSHQVDHYYRPQMFHSRFFFSQNKRKTFLNLNTAICSPTVHLFLQFFFIMDFIVLLINIYVTYYKDTNKNMTSFARANAQWWSNGSCQQYSHQDLWSRLQIAMHHVCV